MDRGAEREREEVLHLSRAINIDHNTIKKTILDSTHTHTHAWAHKVQETNTNHKCEALAITDAGRELGRKGTLSFFLRFIWLSWCGW